MPKTTQSRPLRRCCAPRRAPTPSHLPLIALCACGRTKFLMSAAMGGVVGAGGVIVSSMLTIGRMPPRSQVAPAAAMMATVLGVGSVVRQR